MRQEKSSLSTKKGIVSLDSVRGLFSLGPESWRGASIALVITTLVVWFAIIFSSFPASTQNWVVTLGFALVAAVLSLLLGHLFVTVLGKFEKVPKLYRWVLLGSVFLLFNLFMPGFGLLFNVLLVTIYVVVTSSLLGAGIGALKTESAVQRRVGLAALVLGCLGVIVAVVWAFWPGSPHQVTWSGFEESGVRHISDENPAEQGTYPVRTLTYGSGIDQRRLEYGAEVDIQTDSVDVSSMVRGSGGFTGWLRQNYWGFDLSNVPINGRVWYPEGEGPYPLVLVVHGNHSMDAFSDPGYDYLGELLASRGYIVSSVDQNFLNGLGMLEAVLGGLQEENDARGYLLLQHLGLWHEWNGTQNHYFNGKVDTEKIALIGHSRGGEAAAIAAAFNDLPAHPDNAALSFDFDFDIGAVIAIAPSDGQYRPRRMSTPLEDINYLVLQGSVDSDVRSFVGARQYDRASFSPDYQGFKAAVYIHNANHGQFNTRWGKIDFSAGRWFLNLSQIMSAAEQESAAKIFISAFLEATLNGEQEYERLFENPLSGREWLPETVYLSQYQRSDTLVLASFDEDLNLNSATLAGGKLSGANLTTWREEPPVLGTDQRRDTVSVRLGWDHELKGIGTYSMELPEDFTLAENYQLTFALANLARDNTPVDLTVRVTDNDGQEATLPLSHLTSLPPALPYRMYKAPLQSAFETEPVFTTFVFEFENFLAENDRLNLAGLSTIDFIFDITSTGEIYLDDLGVRPVYAFE